MARESLSSIWHCADVTLSQSSRHEGKGIISNMYGWPVDDEKTHSIWLKMYSSFVQAIDA
jgi:hypothetical protein